MQKAGPLELNAVVAVSTHRSFRRAAEELGMSPSALSHAVAALEQRMAFVSSTGPRAASRSRKRVSSSSRGCGLPREISSAMEAVNQFRDSPSGTLRLAAPESAALMVMSPIVIEFLKRYPDMRRACPRLVAART